MGQLLAEDVRDSEGMDLVAGFDLVDVGSSLGENVVVSHASDLAKILDETKPDVLIEFTIASAAVENAKVAAEKGVNLVVGTTGLSKDQKAEMTKQTSTG